MNTIRMCLKFALNKNEVLLFFDFLHLKKGRGLSLKNFLFLN